MERGKSYFFLGFVGLFFLVSRVNSEVRLYTSDEEYLMKDRENCKDGVITFPEFTQFTCACVKGVYSFFGEKCSSDLSQWSTHGGDGHCFTLRESQQVRRVEFLTKETGHWLTILDSKYKFVKARYNESTEFPLYRKGDTLVVMNSWTLFTVNGRRICITAPPDHYCFFQKVPKILAFRNGCHDRRKKEIMPTSCKLLNPTSNDFGTACPGHEHNHIKHDENVLGRQKRAIQGQTTSLTVGPTTVQQDLKANDEEFGLPAANGSILIKSQLLAYTTQAALRILEDPPEPLIRPHFKTPAFDLLYLTKEIMQKSCPEHYVPKGHWDMAVETFIALQQRNFKYSETLIDLQELKRIQLSLTKCLETASPIEFMEKNETCVDGEVVKVLEDGSYFKFGEIQSFTLPDGDMLSNKNEPIIETVWKTFLHAHSSCYDTFKTNKATNDHHRYTNILESLFTNDIWDVWMKNEEGKQYELKKDVYAGLLGNALKLMGNVDYCAWFPRLDTNYPWDLARPLKKPLVLRRKRSVEGHGICAEIGQRSRNC